MSSHEVTNWRHVAQVLHEACEAAREVFTTYVREVGFPRPDEVTIHTQLYLEFGNRVKELAPSVALNLERFDELVMGQGEFGWRIAVSQLNGLWAATDPPNGWELTVSAVMFPRRRAKFGDVYAAAISDYGSDGWAQAWKLQRAGSEPHTATSFSHEKRIKTNACAVEFTKEHWSEVVIALADLVQIGDAPACVVVRDGSGLPTEVIDTSSVGPILELLEGDALAVVFYNQPHTRIASVLPFVDRVRGEVRTKGGKNLHDCDFNPLSKDTVVFAQDEKTAELILSVLSYW